MKIKHCWNEKKEEWYKTESIGVNRFLCLGCNMECRIEDED